MTLHFVESINYHSLEKYEDKICRIYKDGLIFIDPHGTPGYRKKF
jgi:hypothetical protein